MWDDDESDKSWRYPNAKKMTFDEMTARAQYEWQRAEDAEAEVRALHARADAPPTLAEAMTVPEVRALFAKRDDGAFKFLRHDGLCAFIGGYGYCDCGLDAALANLGDTP
jgi:hypothetical protein